MLYMQDEILEGFYSVNMKNQLIYFLRYQVYTDNYKRCFQTWSSLIENKYVD